MRNRTAAIFTVLGTAMVLGTAIAKDEAGSKDVSILCLIYDDLSLYDLRPIQSSSKDYVAEQGTEKFYFNLCGQTIGSCSAD